MPALRNHLTLRTRGSLRAMAALAVVAAFLTDDVLPIKAGLVIWAVAFFFLLASFNVEAPDGRHPILRLVWPCSKCSWAYQWADQEHQCPKHTHMKTCGQCATPYPPTAQPGSRGRV